MYSIINSGGLSGLNSYIAHVEVDVTPSLPAFNLVGKLSGEVKEAKERVRVAMKNCGIEIPPAQITVNISPANIHKTGTAYDLPIALGILDALGRIKQHALDDVLAIGELSLDGDLKQVSGVLPIVMECARASIARCIVPYGNYAEAVVVSGVEIIPAHNLSEVTEYLNGNITTSDTISPHMQQSTAPLREITPGTAYDVDFSDIIGQEACKRAALIAVAGNHHLLLSGPPGAGKTMIAKRIPTIMPPLSEAECLEVSTIYSICGLLNDKRPLITSRPFLAPHHTVTTQALSGGGINPRPGIISQAHKGVLFLDEFPEYDRECIEVLREPLEEKTIQVSRSRSTYTYPADFMLVAAANPCPCGYYPNRNLCNCTDSAIARYRSRISGPIKDRIDIIVAAKKVEVSDLMTTKAVKTPSRDVPSESAQMRAKVTAARAIQAKRFDGTTLTCNSDITPSLINIYCPLGPTEQDFMLDISSSMNLTARSYHKLLRVARTIADIEDSPDIRVEHLAEAVCYRG